MNWALVIISVVFVPAISLAQVTSNPLSAGSLPALLSLFGDLIARAAVIIYLPVVTYIGLQGIEASSKGDANKVGTMIKAFWYATLFTFLLIAAKPVTLILQTTLAQLPGA